MKPINLNKARKEKARTKAKVVADRNAVIHGRSKAERMLDAAQNEQARARLAELKFEDE